MRKEVRKDARRHRELQPNRPEIAQPELETGTEQEGQLVVGCEHGPDPAFEARLSGQGQCSHGAPAERIREDGADAWRIRREPDSGQPGDGVRVRGSDHTAARGDDPGVRPVPK